MRIARPTSRASWLTGGWRVALAGLVVVISGCAGTPAAPERSTTPSQGRTGPKTVTIAFPIDPIALGGSMSGGVAVVPSRYFREFPNAYLTTYNTQDEPVPWLAAAMPSLDDGTWKALDDGRMEVTWKLRPGIKWHDGVDLTSDDLQVQLGDRPGPNHRGGRPERGPLCRGGGNAGSAHGGVHVGDVQLARRSRRRARARRAAPARARERRAARFIGQPRISPTRPHSSAAARTGR